MNVFFSDLDHTLIYSYRRTIDGGKVLVEQLDGKEQSYMTEYAFSFFRDAEWLSLVPVTTRSEAQYRRLLIPEVFHIQYALICNGGKLLVRGVEDQEWSKETKELALDDLPDMERIGEELQKMSGRDIRKPECYYSYVKTEKPERVCEILETRNPKGNIRIEHDHSKVYLFPVNLNKGMAVRRFMERFGTDVSVAAGDSIIDIPMLNAVDYPLAAAAVCERVVKPNVRRLSGDIISDQVCKALAALHSDGII